MINPEREMLPLDSDGDSCDDSEHEEIVSIEEADILEEIVSESDVDEKNE